MVIGSMRHAGIITRPLWILHRGSLIIELAETTIKSNQWTISYMMRRRDRIGDEEFFEAPEFEQWCHENGGDLDVTPFPFVEDNTYERTSTFDTVVVANRKWDLYGDPHAYDKTSVVLDGEFSVETPLTYTQDGIPTVDYRPGGLALEVSPGQVVEVELSE